MSNEVFPWASHNGTLVPYENLVIHAESMAMRYALSAFEGIRGYTQGDSKKVVFFALEEHLKRLNQTLELAKMPRVEPKEVEKTAFQLLQKNQVETDCYLRIAVNASAKGLLKSDVVTEIFASLRASGRKPWLKLNKGLSIFISPYQKPGDHVFPQRAKLICNYPGPRLAYLEAQAQGFDEVLLTNPEGYLTEAPTANLFLVYEDRVLTPRVKDGILEGITRKVFIDLCRQMGWVVEECSIKPEDALKAKEAFLCGTGLELAQIRQINDQILPVNPQLVPQLVDAYFKLVRGN